MGKESLERFRRSLQLLSRYHVEKIYREAHEGCKLTGDELPNPQAIQELVQAWKTLWGWRRHRN